MSKLTTGIFGAIALSLSFGAVQFALGRDLSAAGVLAASGPQTAAINRAAKADRVAGPTLSGLPMQTISLRLNGVSDTSVLVRIPLAQANRNGASAPSLSNSGSGSPTVACEPSVSVLTEVAKQLPPGRCVT